MALVGQLGGLGGGPGQFYAPENVAFGDDGRVHVVDTGNDRVQVFTPALTYDCEFGSTGTGANNFDVPTDAAFDALGRLVIPDYANNRIRIWGYPPVPTVATTWGALKQIYR